jgi:hypothetical protein
MQVYLNTLFQLHCWYSHWIDEWLNDEHGKFTYLFNNSVSISICKARITWCVMTEWLKTNDLERIWKERPRPNLRFYSGICLVRVNRTRKNFNPDNRRLGWDSIWTPSNYESETISNFSVKSELYGRKRVNLVERDWGKSPKVSVQIANLRVKNLRLRNYL